MNLKPMVLGGTAFVILALVTLLGAADTVRAGTFSPTLSACLDDATTKDPDIATPGDPEECDGDNSAGASSDFTVQLDVPDGDVNFAALVSFLPPEWGITPGDEIPIGAVVGQLSAVATLGIINGQCDNQLVVEFIMLNSSLDITDTVSFDDADDNGTGDVFEDKDENGLQEVFEKYPEFINRVIDNAQPIRRSAGITRVAGADVLLQFLVFEPGSDLIREIPSDEDLGYATVVFLQAIGDPDAEPEPGPITDFCTPLRTTNFTFGVSKDNGCTDAVPLDQLDTICIVGSAMLQEEGATEPDESGTVLSTNPEEGDYTFTIVALGQRDADNDGYENTLDTCPFDINQGDPRIRGDGDNDLDGLDAACDPNDDPLTGGTNSDEDLDGYVNRQDNCPLIANGEDEDNQNDSDVNEEGDPRPDGIGDACDANPTVPDGEAILVQATSEISIGPGGPTTQETPDATPSGDDDDDGGGSAVIIIVIIVIAAVAAVGGGAFYFMRRGGGA